MEVANQFYQGKKMVLGGEVCEFLGIHSNTLQRWIARGVPIPYHQVPGMGRYFILEDVIAWWETTKRGPPAPVSNIQAAEDAIRAWEKRLAELKKEAA